MVYQFFDRYNGFFTGFWRFFKKIQSQFSPAPERDLRLLKSKLNLISSNERGGYKRLLFWFYEKWVQIFGTTPIPRSSYIANTNSSITFGFGFGALTPGHHDGCRRASAARTAYRAYGREADIFFKFVKSSDLESNTFIPGRVPDTDTDSYRYARKVISILYTYTRRHKAQILLSLKYQPEKSNISYYFTCKQKVCTACLILDSLKWGHLNLGRLEGNQVGGSNSEISNLLFLFFCLLQGLFPKTQVHVLHKLPPQQTNRISHRTVPPPLQMKNGILRGSSRESQIYRRQ